MSKLDELLEDVEEVRVFTARPGDTLVLRFTHAVPASLADAIMERVKALLDGDIKVLILDQGTTLDVVRKTDADAETP